MGQMVDGTQSDIVLAPATKDGRGAAGELIDIGRIGWNFRWLILASFVSSLGIGYLLFSSAKPKYQSTAQITITRRYSPAFDPSAGGSRIDELVSGSMLLTQMMVITSPAVVDGAVQGKDPKDPDDPDDESREPLHGLKTLQEAREEGKIVPFIQGGLSVDQGGGTRSTQYADVLTVAYTGDDPAETQQILAAVVASYEDYLNAESESDESEIKQLLAQMNENFQGQYEDTKKALIDAVEKGDAPLVQFGDNRRAQSLDIAYLEQEKLVVDELEREIERYSVLLAKIDEIRMKGGDPNALVDLIMRELGVPPTSQYVPGSIESQVVASLKAERVRIQGEITKLEVGGAGPESLTLKALYKRLEDNAAEIVREQAAFDEARQLIAPEDPALAVQMYRDSLENHLEIKREQYAKASERFDEAKETARAAQLAYVNINLLNQELDAWSQATHAISEQLMTVANEDDSASPYIPRVIQPATFGEQVSPRFVRIMGMSGFLGIFAGCAIAFLLHSMDRSFADVDEVGEFLQTPVVGRIPEFGDPRRQEVKQGVLMDASLRTFHAPLSQSSEAYRALRNSLYFSIRGQGHTVVQVTSPVPGDGKSTLAANLAVAVAQSGRRVLLVDADFRRPRLHLMFGLDNSVGMSSVIDEQAELADAIVASELDKLSLMPCGPIPSNPSELLSSVRFQELLQALRSQYDFVIVDTPPLLAVSDPAAVAPRVDGVLLAMRMRKNAKPLASRASQILGHLGANILGVVVNGVTASHERMSGYGYGYGYGGKYGEGYGYGYGYSADEAAAQSKGKRSAPSPKQVAGAQPFDRLDID